MPRVEHLRPYLQNLRPNGKGATARCPGHDDRENSLSITQSGQRILLHCFAGCSFEAILAALPEEARALFTRKGRTPKAEDYPVEAFLREKLLTPETAKAWELTTVTRSDVRATRIPFKSEAATELTCQYRTGPHQFSFPRGSHQVLFGLDHLVAYPSHELWIVEGCSDTLTLAQHSIPVLGLPSAGYNLSPHDLELISRFQRIIVTVEPGRSGQTVLSRPWLLDPKIKDRALLLYCAESWKDPSGLFLQIRSRFAETWATLRAGAIPLNARLTAEQEKLREEMWAKCAGLASSPNILELFERDVLRSLAGEGRNAKLLYLGLTSRCDTHPVSIAVKGPSSSGKNATQRAVLNFFPPEAYYALTASSERALIYDAEPLSHRFIVIAEAGGIGDEFAGYIIRSLLSEGELCYKTVEKTDSGLCSRTIRKPGPTGLLTTTTRAILDRELETRLLSLTTDDSKEQTAEIFKLLASENGARPALAYDLETWRALQSWIASSEHRVTIPFGSELAARTRPVATRLRRDFGQVLALIRASAILHQATRQRDAEGRIVATIADYENVWHLVRDPICEAVEGSVAPNIRATVMAVSDLLETAEPGETLSVSRLARAMKLDRSTASRRVAVCLERGFLKNTENHPKKPFKLALGDPLPEAVEVLPSPEQLAEPASKPVEPVPWEEVVI